MLSLDPASRPSAETVSHHDLFREPLVKDGDQTGATKRWGKETSEGHETVFSIFLAFSFSFGFTAVAWRQGIVIDLYRMLISFIKTPNAFMIWCLYKILMQQSQNRLHNESYICVKFFKHTSTQALC